MPLVPLRVLVDEVIFLLIGFTFMSSGLYIVKFGFGAPSPKPIPHIPVQSGCKLLNLGQLTRFTLLVARVPKGIIELGSGAIHEYFCYNPIWHRCRKEGCFTF
jgi:hypothetical protein